VRYFILDVFTARPLTGNQLAVVMDADALGEREMQAIAREFNLPETAFVLKPEREVHSARIRIFTSAAELPFAGHPTIGTAVCLGQLRRAAGAGEQEMVLVLEEDVGPVRCGVHVGEGRHGHATFDVPRQPQAVPFAFDREALAMAIGLVPAEIGFENHEPSVYSAGVAFSFVPVRDLAAIARVRPNPAAWEQAFPKVAPAAYLYCRQTTGMARQFHARVFAPGIGLAEDPATGSAVAAFPGVIRQFDGFTAGAHRLVIEQGFEMERPSLITLEVDFEGGAIAASRIGGDAVLIGEGKLLFEQVRLES
jgi:trans-2,3-dihydro-3-hydroxyanthranilate isomerase